TLCRGPGAGGCRRKRRGVPMGARRISDGREADCAVCGSTIEEPRGNTRLAERKVFQSEAAWNRPCEPSLRPPSRGLRRGDDQNTAASKPSKKERAGINAGGRSAIALEGPELSDCSA